MPDEPRDPSTTESHPDGDSSDVVTGPIGRAHLVEPATSAALGADLDELPAVEVSDAPNDQAATPRG
jgi:hypothetical protein